MALISGVGMIAVAVGVVAWWRRRAVKWPWFGLGALAWIASVVAKVAWALPTNHLVEHGLTRLFGAALGAALFWIYIGLLTGLFECGLTWLVVSRTRVRRADWDQSVAFGIGFGAIEAALLGLVLIVWTLIFSSEQASALGISRGGGIALALPVVERLSALAVHAYTCTLVIYAARTRAMRWFWFAFAFKSALDAVAAAAVLGFKAPDSLGRYLLLEGVVAAFAAVALVGLGRLRSRAPA